MSQMTKDISSKALKNMENIKRIFHFHSGISPQFLFLVKLVGATIGRPQKTNDLIKTNLSFADSHLKFVGTGVLDCPFQTNDLIITSLSCTDPDAKFLPSFFQKAGGKNNTRMDEKCPHAYTSYV